MESHDGDETVDRDSETVLNNSPPASQTDLNGERTQNVPSRPARRLRIGEYEHTLTSTTCGFILRLQQRCTY